MSWPAVVVDELQLTYLFCEECIALSSHILELSILTISCNYNTNYNQLFFIISFLSLQLV
jgi:hypothetical protein